MLANREIPERQPAPMEKGHRRLHFGVAKAIVALAIVLLAREQLATFHEVGDLGIAKLFQSGGFKTSKVREQTIQAMKRQKKWDALTKK